jgi:diguanylate cyclase (GGDEF)-like protein/PAS domain S-box-containing protein
VEHVIGVASDVTDIARAESRMHILSSALEQTADLVMITDRDGNIEYVNPAFEKVTGFAREEVLQKKPNILRSGKQSDEFYRSLWLTITAGQPYNEVFINKRKDGSLYYEEKTITPIRNAQKEITHYVATGKDISERMRTQEQLRYMAHHDALTKLPNRTLFLDRLKHSMARARWHNRLVSVMFMDLDRFKDINDTLGHNIGDKLLVQLTQRLANSVRAGDTVARFGGDEFAILLDDIASEKDISRLAKKLLETLVPPFKIDNRELFITASIGVSIFPSDGEDSESLLRNADVAMYRAKEMGRNNYQFYSNEMSARVFERLTLEHSLRYALERDEFFLLYQPQVDSRNGKTIGVEALVRWQHPELGVIMPTDFVPLLEETGLIVPAGEWILRHACGQARRWHEAGLDELFVSVNLSSRQFNNPEFTRNVQSIILDTGIDPRRLELELTESMLMRNASKTINALDTLNEMGVSIAVDDFGTGYSSLNYLRRFPIGTLKIDRSFIHDVIEDPDNAAITTAIIVMAQSLNLTVIAEGVEDEAQLGFLQGLDCYCIQGNLFSKPLSAEELTEKLLGERTGD